MENHVSAIVTSSVPQIVVTEPSPVSVPTQNAVSIVRNIEPIPQASTSKASGVPESNGIPLEEAVGTSEAEPSPGCSSGEFVPAAACNECIVPVSEELPPAVEDPTPEPEQDDDLRNGDVGTCANYCIRIMEYYEKARNVVYSGYALLFWVPLLSLPISAGIMGALYMYKCPASHSLPMFLFTIGIALMAHLTFRICLIIRRMTTSNNGVANMLHTLLLISTFLTITFWITESVAYWKMGPASEPGTLDYCDPHFQTFSFWWNSIMVVVMLAIFIFPA